MRLSLTRQEFIERCRRGKIPVLSCEIPFQRPSSVFNALLQKNSVLLESCKGPERIARYSFLSLEPYRECRVKDKMVEILSPEGRSVSFRKPLVELKEILTAYNQETDPSLPPFQGGAVGFISYDFVHYLERIPKTAHDDLQFPDMHFLVVDRVVAFDHVLKKGWIIACPGARTTGLGYNAGSDNFSEIYDQAESSISRIKRLIENADELICVQGKGKRAKKREIVYEMEKAYYVDMVKRTKSYIKAGDIFQANLSQRVSSDMNGIKPWDMYRKLSEINPSPFAAYVQFDDYCIVSSSPERLVKLYGGVAQTRPIAGTRPRGRNKEEDEHLRQELVLNEKERAEHIMLIDLERNDLGKVCNYGTVEVDERMITEDYSHVIHIVSNVRGLIAPHKDCFDLMKAVFPGGTITGVPKVRCMEIIDELEPVVRGPYTGSIGYIGFEGNMDLNIVIRTFVCKGGRTYVHAGAGIVADSEPEREYQETLKKAEALIKTLFEFS